MSSFITEYVRRASPKPSGPGKSRPKSFLDMIGANLGGGGAPSPSGRGLAAALGTQPDGGFNQHNVYGGSTPYPDELQKALFGTTARRDDMPWNMVVDRLHKMLKQRGPGDTLNDLIAQLGQSQTPQLPGPYQQDVGQVGATYDHAMQQTRALEQERGQRLDQLHAEALKNAQLAAQANQVGEHAAQQAAAQTQVLASERAKAGYDPMMADLASQGVTGAPAQMLAQQQQGAQQDVAQRSSSADSRNAENAIADRQVEAAHAQSVEGTDNLARSNLTNNVGQVLAQLLGAKTQAVAGAESDNARAQQAAALQQAQLGMQSRAADQDRIGKALQAAAQSNQGVYPKRDAVVNQVHQVQAMAQAVGGIGGRAVPWAAPTVQLFNMLSQQASNASEAQQMLQDALTNPNKATRQLAGSANKAVLGKWISQYFDAAPNQVDPETFRTVLSMYGGH